MTAAQRPCFKMPTGLLSRYPVYCNICTKTLSQNSKRQRAYFLDTKSVVTDAQEPRRENSKCQQTSRADFPHALCTAAGPRHKGVAPLQDERRRQRRNGLPRINYRSTETGGVMDRAGYKQQRSLHATSPSYSYPR